MKLQNLMMVVGMTTLLFGCVSHLPWEDAHWGKRMETYREAKAVEIEYLDPASSSGSIHATRSERDIVLVVEKEQLDWLNSSLPIAYMRKSKRLNPGRIKENEPCYIVYYPTDGDLNKEGEIYPATCVFVALDGLVYHGRGGLVNPDFHGLPLPEYLNVVRELYQKGRGL
jgi:hypothetical protein